MALVLRHMVGIQRTLGESPTRFKPLLYLPEEKARGSERMPPEGAAWCEGYMAGVKLRDDEWQPLFDTPDARDWIFPIEALAFGDRDDDFTEWVDSDEKRAELIDELPVAAVLIYRFWQERRNAKRVARRRHASRHGVRGRAQVAAAVALTPRSAPPGPRGRAGCGQVPREPTTAPEPRPEASARVATARGAHRRP